MSKNLPLFAGAAEAIEDGGAEAVVAVVESALEKAALDTEMAS